MALVPLTAGSGAVIVPSATFNVTNGDQAIAEGDNLVLYTMVLRGGLVDTPLISVPEITASDETWTEQADGQDQNGANTLFIQTVWTTVATQAYPGTGDFSTDLRMQDELTADRPGLCMWQLVKIVTTGGDTATLVPVAYSGFDGSPGGTSRYSSVTYADPVTGVGLGFGAGYLLGIAPPTLTEDPPETDVLNAQTLPDGAYTFTDRSSIWDPAEESIEFDSLVADGLSALLLLYESGEGPPPISEPANRSLALRSRRVRAQELPYSVSTQMVGSDLVKGR